MNFTQIIFRGIGQVMFQNNVYSGALFLIGIFYNSILLGLAALLGTIISTVAAQIFKYPKGDIQNGLYGFNGALAGISVLFFLEINFVTIIALAIAAVISTVIMRFLLKILPPFTIPFVIASWLAIYTLLLAFNFQIAIPQKPISETIEPFSAIGNSIGLVMFQENMITGFIFLAAIFINNKLMAIYAVFGAALGSLTGWLLYEPIPSINTGLMGYNAVLCAIALTGKSWMDFLWISIAIILSTLIKIGMEITGIIALTAPFVLATWIVLLLKKQSFALKKRLV